MASPNLSPQGLAMYELMLKDTAFIKRQQWATTNYAALIYAAIVWVVHNLKPSPKENSVLMLLTIFTAIASVSILIWFQRDLGKLRKRISHANEKFFDDDETSGLSIRVPDEDPYVRGWQILIALVMVCVAGAVVVFFALMAGVS
jgi:hypothetical protein